MRPAGANEGRGAQTLKPEAFIPAPRTDPRRSWKLGSPGQCPRAVRSYIPDALRKMERGGGGKNPSRQLAQDALDLPVEGVGLFFK